MAPLRRMLLLLPLLFLGVLSQTNPQDVICVEALYKIYDDLTFAGIGYGKSYVQACRNPLKVTSIHAAAKTYCKPEDIEPGFHYLSDTCKGHGSLQLLPESAVAANLTDEAIGNMPVVDRDIEDTRQNLTAPVLISRRWFDLGYRTTNVYEAQKRTDQRYAYSMYGFWGGVLVLGMLNRLATYAVERRQAKRLVHTAGNGHEGTRKHSSLARMLRPVTSRYSLARKFLTMPSALPPFHQQKLLGCTIPTRLESFVILSFWAVSIILCSVSYNAFKENTYYDKISTQLWRYVANRTGMLSFANLPIIWMFSGRNNIFLWLTGWSFSTFNLFHRHVARVATLQAIVHGIAYTAFYAVGYSASTYRAKYQFVWFSLGVVAVITMSFIVLSSFSWFRIKVYETFLLIHITLAVVTVVALFYHASKFDGIYDPYLWPLVAIWGFDRLLRIIRVVYCNLHIRRCAGTSLGQTKATVTYVKEANVLIVDVIPAANYLGLGPGQHYYLYQPFRLTGWESHPFTLAYWSKPGTPQLPAGTREEPGVQTEKGIRPNPSTAPTAPWAESPKSVVSGGDMPRLSFWIRPYDGWTRQLRDRCVRSAQSTITTTLLAEGPYGKSEPLWMFDDVLMIAGGTGIAAVAPYLQDHIRRRSNPAGKPTTRTRSITVLWANRDEAFIRRLASAELSQSLAHADITVAFYCTWREPASARSSAEGSTENDEPSSGDEPLGELKDAHEAVHSRGARRALHHGRPDVRLAVEEAAAAARDAGSRLAVMVCGPAGMTDTARAAAYGSIRTCGVSLEYFEESFGW